MSDHDPRLPDHAEPRHYEIELAPDLDTATFSGSVGIDVDIVTATRELELNAAELEIDRAVLEVDGREIELEVRLDAATERMHIDLAEELAPGPVRLTVEYRGVLNDRLRGFYRSTYTDDDGTHTIATTQFQSTDARRAFPCWDEPAHKATFATTLVVDADHLAVSNTAEVGSESLPDGRRRVRFAPSMPMSTYLVAFVVGPLEATEPIDVDGVPVRVVHRPGQGHLTGFALDVAVHALRWFGSYYGIPYPSDKLDLVGVPDFAFGAMENLGCVTFRDVLLLVDPEQATQTELENVALVVNHELAHMWFGDLVTMRWWEGIWLNEAFATFMETACTDAYRPDWEIWTTFARSRAAAFDTDALAATRPIEYPVVSPADAEGMFDVLTYEKGASVVRMLERFLGEDVFRAGVNHYLRTHAHGNTDTSDLWDALEHTSDMPVRRMMDDWILQGGHPTVEVERTPHGLTISQRRFTLDADAADDRAWAIPLRIRDAGGDERRLLLDGRATTLTRDPDEMVVTVNSDASGFYRSRLDPTDQAAVLADLEQLTAAERHALVDDAWAFTVAGTATATDFLTLAEEFGGETDLTVWQALSSGLAGLVRLVDEQAAPALRERIATLARPAAERSGLDPEPDETARDRELRATLLRLLGAVADDPATIAAARERLDHVDATLASAALTVVAHHGEEADHERIRERWADATDPQSEQRHLRALADLPRPDWVQRALAETIDGTIRSQDGPYLIRRALTNRHAGWTAWSFVVDNWTTINDVFPTNSIARMLEGITALDHPGQPTDVAEFMADHPVPQGSKQITQHLERQRINAALRAREIEPFSAHLLTPDF